MIMNTGGVVSGGPNDSFAHMHYDSRGLPTFIIMKDVKPTRRGARTSNR